MENKPVQEYAWASKIKELSDEKKLYESAYNVLLARINTAKLKHFLSLELYEFLVNGNEELLKEDKNEI